MTDTLTRKQVFEFITCTGDRCGITFAVEDGFVQARRSDRQTFYCPNGHPRWYPGQTPEQTIAKLKAELTHARDQNAAETRSLRTRVESERRTKIAYKGQATKLRKKIERVEAGVCPHCNRSFQNLARHMVSQHSQHPQHKDS